MNFSGFFLGIIIWKGASLFNEGGVVFQLGGGGGGHTVILEYRKGLNEFCYRIDMNIAIF